MSTDAPAFTAPIKTGTIIGSSQSEIAVMHSSTPNAVRLRIIETPRPGGNPRVAIKEMTRTQFEAMVDAGRDLLGTE